MNLYVPKPDVIKISRAKSGRFFVRQGRYHEPHPTYEAAKADAAKLKQDADARNYPVTVIDHVAGEAA